MDDSCIPKRITIMFASGCNDKKKKKKKKKTGKSTQISATLGIFRKRIVLSIPRSIGAGQLNAKHIFDI